MPAADYPALDLLWTLALLMAVLAVYLLPTLLAWGRRVPHLGSIAVINVFLGWTLVGWVVALAMAARSAPAARSS